MHHSRYEHKITVSKAIKITVSKAIKHLIVCIERGPISHGGGQKRWRQFTNIPWFKC